MAVKSKARTTPAADSEAPTIEEPGRSQRGESNHPVPSAPMPAVVSRINKTVLGLSPTMSTAGAYLSAGLATQLGFFSSANQYQYQSMVAMAAVVGAIKRRPPKAKAVTLPSEPQAEVQQKTHSPEYYMGLAEEEVKKCES
ncbi:MAG: RebB family R body protein [Candidatus Thiodiazotropha sp.]